MEGSCIRLQIMVITGLLSYRFLIRLNARKSLVHRGLTVQEFIAREIWDEWDALVQHRGFDIVSRHRGQVEVKYFYWDVRRFSQAIRDALKQHRARHVDQLVLVSTLIVWPSRELRDESITLKNIIEKSTIGVVICEMSDITEEIQPVRMWHDVLREVISQLPPDHEFAGLTPDELMEQISAYLLQQVVINQDRLEEHQNRLEQRYERLEQRQERLEQRQERLEQLIKEGFQMLKEELQSLRDKQQD